MTSPDYSQIHVHGDIVGRDSVITIGGDFSNSSGVTVGRGWQARVEYGGQLEEIDRAFEAVQKAVLALPATPDGPVRARETMNLLRVIHSLMRKGEDLDQSRLTSYLRTLAADAPDIHALLIGQLKEAHVVGPAGQLIEQIGIPDGPDLSAANRDSIQESLSAQNAPPEAIDRLQTRLSDLAAQIDRGDDADVGIARESLDELLRGAPKLAPQIAAWLARAGRRSMPIQILTHQLLGDYI